MEPYSDISNKGYKNNTINFVKKIIPDAKRHSNKYIESK